MILLALAVTNGFMLHIVVYIVHCNTCLIASATLVSSSAEDRMRHMQCIGGRCVRGWWRFRVRDGALLEVGMCFPSARRQLRAVSHVSHKFRPRFTCTSLHEGPSGVGVGLVYMGVVDWGGETCFVPSLSERSE